MPLVRHRVALLAENFHLREPSTPVRRSARRSVLRPSLNFESSRPCASGAVSDPQVPDRYLRATPTTRALVSVRGVITTVLVQYPWITTVTFVSLVTIGPAVGYWLVVRPDLAKVLALASTLPVAASTLIPVSRDLAVGCATEWDFPTFGAVELMANVVLFVPPALLLAIGVRRPLVVLLALSLVSGLVEVTQAFVTALGRSCSTSDWLANTLGAALGAAIATLALRLRRTRD